MIAKITGKVDEVDLGSIIVDVSGIGYKVFVTNSLLSSLKVDNPISLFTYFAVRENSQDLYGFQNKEEKNFFELLLSISGIGPKSALGILNTAPIETIKEGVASGDASHLTKVSGIGRKSAEKIIVELKDKLGTIEGQEGGNLSGSGMAIEALTSLGYSERDARSVIQKIDKNLSTEEMIKEALRQLGA
ncbi:Holliday junction branch migration protein RuvA [Candidatus Nomurabacteria bacterium]|nr:Holliday junction branch migration protein RuvA [Candidatus Nomurabacteria bacterium]